MAIHYSKHSMLQESLREMVAVAEYCVNFRKDPNVWGSQGCYGYPAAILLLSVADSIGSYIIGDTVRKHFDILNHKDYYNLALNQSHIDIIYKFYRNPLVHEAELEPGVVLDIGMKNNEVFEVKGEFPFLNLLPFLELTKIVVSEFLNEHK